MRKMFGQRTAAGAARIRMFRAGWPHVDDRCLRVDADRSYYNDGCLMQLPVMLTTAMWMYKKSPLPQSSFPPSFHPVLFSRLRTVYVLPRCSFTILS